MFTKTQIEEIAKKLAAMGKKDSQFKVANSLGGSEYFPILQNGENKKLSLIKLINYTKNSIVPDIENAINTAKDEILAEIAKMTNEDVTLSVVCDIPNAKIYLNGKLGTSVTVKASDLVSIRITADGYSTFNQVVCVHKTQIIHIKLDDGEPTTFYDFTINPNPEDSTVIINDVERKTISVPEGTLVTWEVSKAGYITQSNTAVVDKDTSLDITLEKVPEQQVVFTIIPSPEDATVKLNDVNRKSISVFPGTSVDWEVSRAGYTTQSGTEIVNTTTNKEVTLEKKSFTLTVTATPEDSTIKINEEERSSITVPYNTEVHIEVSKEGYTTVSKDVTVTKDETIPITLYQSQVTLTINPTPSDASVELNSQSIKSITVNYGDTVHIKVSKTGYETYEEDYKVTSTETKNIVLEEITEVSWSNFVLKQAEDSENTITSVPVSGGNISLSGEVTVNYSDGSTKKKDITSDIVWSVDGEGCTSQGNGVFLWSKNDGVDSRSATISGSVNDPYLSNLLKAGELTASITTTQVGSAEYIDLSPKELIYEASGGSKTLNINSNTDWTLN